LRQEAPFATRQLSLGSRPRLLAERCRQVAFDEAALGPIHRRATDADAERDVVVFHPGVGGEQDLRPLELARPLVAAAQHRPEFVALDLAQFNPVPYIHRCPPEVEGTTDESQFG
jgi:hypothetical protein